MATLQEIQNQLNVELAEKKLSQGRKKPNKNRYYRLDDFYIVELTQGKWMIVSNSNTVRRLLRENTWCFHSTRYAKTNVDDTMKSFHQVYLNYESDLVCDHVNRMGFDNRFENLRIVTPRENSRNQTKRCNNTSGTTGICEKTIQGIPYVISHIRNNNDIQIFSI